MCVHGNIVENPDSFVPSLVEVFQLGTKEIIETGRVEAASIDLVEIHDNIWMAEVKFLIQGMDFPNKIGPLDCHVNGHGVA